MILLGIGIIIGYVIACNRKQWAERIGKYVDRPQRKDIWKNKYY